MSDQSTPAPFRIATDYKTHPATGAGQIVARTHGAGGTRRLTRGYDPALSAKDNHRLTARRLAAKLTDAQPLNGTGKVYTVPSEPHSSAPYGGAYDWDVIEHTP